MKTLKETLQNSLDNINESNIKYTKEIDVSSLDLGDVDVVPVVEYDEFKSIKPSDNVLITSAFNLDFSGIDLTAKLVHFVAEEDITISNLSTHVDELCVKSEWGSSILFDRCDFKIKNTLGLCVEDFDYGSTFRRSKIDVPYMFVRETDPFGTIGDIFTVIQNENEEDCVDHEGSRYGEFEPAISDYTDLKNKKIDLNLKKLFGIPPKTTLTIAAETDSNPVDGCVVFTNNNGIEKKLAKFDTSDNYSILSCPRWIKSGELAITTTIKDIKKVGLGYLLCSSE